MLLEVFGSVSAPVMGVGLYLWFNSKIKEMEGENKKQDDALKNEISRVVELKKYRIEQLETSVSVNKSALDKRIDKVHDRIDKEGAENKKQFENLSGKIDTIISELRNIAVKIAEK